MNCDGRGRAGCRQKELGGPLNCWHCGTVPNDVLVLSARRAQHAFFGPSPA